MGTLEEKIRRLILNLKERKMTKQEGLRCGNNVRCPEPDWRLNKAAYLGKLERIAKSLERIAESLDKIQNPKVRL